MASLSESERQRYQSDGYVVPSFKLPSSEVTALRKCVDKLIENNSSVRPEHLVNAHLANPNAEGVQGANEILELARHPDILDLVEAVIGPDIVLWGCQLFCKPAGDGMEVPWHQDGHYWPIRPLANCTVWVAIDDSLVENGCLRVIPKSHSDGVLFDHHTDNRERLTLNQAVNSEHMRSAEPANVELRSGEMSLHDVYLIHGSSENVSDRRRAGIAIRYMPGTSEFKRDLIEPGDSSGYQIDFSQRPLWLLRGNDQTGKNDFTVGHSH